MLWLFPRRHLLYLVETAKVVSRLHKGKKKWQKRIQRIHLPFLHLLFEFIMVRRRRVTFLNMDFGSDISLWMAHEGLASCLSHFMFKSQQNLLSLLVNNSGQWGRRILGNALMLPGAATHLRSPDCLLEYMWPRCPKKDPQNTVLN